MQPEPTYTDRPCRCGFDGSGVHQCHAGRDPGYPGGRCPNPAGPARFVAKPLGTFSLAGCQMKVVGDFFHYCDACWAEYGSATAKETK